MDFFANRTNGTNSTTAPAATPRASNSSQAAGHLSARAQTPARNYSPASPNITPATATEAKIIKLPYGNYDPSLLKIYTKYAELQNPDTLGSHKLSLSAAARADILQKSLEQLIENIKSKFNNNCKFVEELASKLNTNTVNTNIEESQAQLLQQRETFQQLILDLCLTALDKKTENNVETHSIGLMIVSTSTFLSEIIKSKYALEVQQKSDGIKGALLAAAGVPLFLLASTILPLLALALFTEDQALKNYDQRLDANNQTTYQQVTNNQGAFIRLYTSLVKHLQQNSKTNEVNKDLLANLQFLQKKLMPGIDG